MGVLTPILATEDPYDAAARFVAAGWTLVFETPRDSGDPLACVELAGSQVLLVELHVSVPASDIEGIFAAHRAHADSTTGLAAQPWGETAFHATLAGYRFLIAAEPG